MSETSSPQKSDTSPVIFEAYRPEYTGTPGGMWPIALKNFLFNLVTLTIYRFWARTNVRRQLWANTKIKSEPLEYTGTGKELFIGFLVVLVAVMIPLVILAAAASFFPPLIIVLYGLIFWLLGIAIYRARKYRLSRTLWRSVRFGQDGSSNTFSWKMIGYGLLTVITLGFAKPVSDNALFSYQMKHTWFGDRNFKYEAKSGPLYKSYLISYFGSILVYLVGFGALAALLSDSFASMDPAAGPEIGVILTLYAIMIPILILIGLIMSIYYTRMLCHFADNSTVDGLTFKGHYRAFPLVKLIIGNVFLVIFTLGIAGPLAQQRIFRFAVQNLEINGTLDVAAIQQSTQDNPGSGEGLADAFDIGTV